jgi:hypothetical protein
VAPEGVLSEARAFLRRKVPRLPPVLVAVAGLDGRPGRVTVDPDGSARFEDYPGDVQG